MKTALLVIDPQKIYTDEFSEMFCPDSKKTIGRINQLIEIFQKKGAPIIYIRHMHKSDGSDIGNLFNFTGESREEFGFIEGSEEVEFDDSLNIVSHHLEIIKKRYSAFQGTSLDKDLKALGVQRLVISGFMTNFCCESTARDALDKDYLVDFIIDATGTPGVPGMEEAAVRRAVAKLLGAGFGRIFTTSEYMEEPGLLG